MPRGNKLVPRTAPTPLVSAAFAAFVLLCFVTLLSVFLCLFGVFGAKTAFFEEIAAVSPRWCGALWFDMFLMPLITMLGSPQKHFWLFLVPKLHQTAFVWAIAAVSPRWCGALWFEFFLMTNEPHDLLSRFSTTGTWQLDLMIYWAISLLQANWHLDFIISWALGKWQLDSMISWVTSLIEANGNGIYWSLELFRYLKQMTPGPNDLLSYFSIEANDNWISCFFELLLYFRQVRTGLHDLLSSWQMTTGLDDLLSYFSNWSHGNGTYWSLYFFLLEANDSWTQWSLELLLYFRQVTAGVNDLWAPGKWQLDSMISWATSLLQANDNWAYRSPELQAHDNWI